MSPYSIQHADEDDIVDIAIDLIICQFTDEQWNEFKRRMRAGLDAPAKPRPNEQLVAA